MRLTQAPSGLQYSDPGVDGVVSMFVPFGTHIKSAGEAVTGSATGKYDPPAVKPPDDSTDPWTPTEWVVTIPVKDILHLATLAIRSGLVELSEQADDGVILGLLRGAGPKED